MPQLCKHNVIKPCKNNAIKGSDYCHLKSHHPTTAEYEIAVSKLVDGHLSTTVDPRMFRIYDVVGDGACMYRCLAQMLYSHGRTRAGAMPLDIPEYTRELMSDEDEDAVARKMQDLLKTWLYNNKNEHVECLGCTVEELVLSTHEDVTNMEDYRILFDIYAGEPDLVIINHPDGSKEKAILPFRWGGAAEQYAFTQIFEIPLRVYDMITCDTKTFEIRNCTLRTKNYRLREIQAFEDFKGKPYLPPVNLIITEKRRGAPHYMCAILK